MIGEFFEWFTGLEGLAKIYGWVGTISLFIFLIQFLLGIFGIGDFEAEVDTDVDGDGAMSYLSIKTIVAFLMGGSWGGLYVISKGLSTPGAVICSLIFGIIFGAISYQLYKLMKKGEKNSIIEMYDYERKIGTVLIEVGANSSSVGEVSVVVNGTQYQVDAITNDNLAISKGMEIVVVDSRDNQVVVTRVKE